MSNACALIRSGINNFAQARTLYQELLHVRRVASGLLGDYHFKMLIDFRVSAEFLPPRCVFTYPVCSRSGTAQGLKRVYQVKGSGYGTKTLEVMLQELTHRVMVASTSWWQSDHIGNVGAALCWEERRGKASNSTAYDSRFHETSLALWETELEQLAEHGFTIYGYNA